MAKTQTYKRWTEAELSFLRANYDSMSAEDLANELGRTLDSVWSKAEQIGLRKRKERRKNEL